MPLKSAIYNDPDKGEYIVTKLQKRVVIEPSIVDNASRKPIDTKAWEAVEMNFELKK